LFGLHDWRYWLIILVCGVMIGHIIFYGFVGLEGIGILLGCILSATMIVWTATGDRISLEAKGRRLKAGPDTIKKLLEDIRDAKRSICLVSGSLTSEAYIDSLIEGKNGISLLIDKARAGVNTRIVVGPKISEKTLGFFRDNLPQDPKEKEKVDKYLRLRQLPCWPFWHFLLVDDGERLRFECSHEAGKSGDSFVLSQAHISLVLLLVHYFGRLWQKGADLNLLKPEN